MHQAYRVNFGMEAGSGTSATTRKRHYNRINVLRANNQPAIREPEMSLWNGFSDGISIRVGTQFERYDEDFTQACNDFAQFLKNEVETGKKTNKWYNDWIQWLRGEVKDYKKWPQTPNALHPRTIIRTINDKF